MAIRLEVDCYSGYRADERPRRFTLLTARAPADPPPAHEVTEVLDRWYGPGYQCFRVRADDGGIYILRHDGDRWTLDSFRRD